MFRSLTLKRKLIILGLTLSVGPLILIAVASIHEGKTIRTVATEGIADLALRDLDHIVQGIYETAKTQHETLQKSVLNGLRVSQRVLRDAGSVEIARGDTVEWEAVNQFTKNSRNVSLPKMLVGGQLLGRNRDLSKETPVVDEVQQLVGGTCTIFQRMNAAGDMLRIATNVRTLDDKRAIGTYIPAVNPDGKPNPVVSALMNGRTYTGLAYVVNAWYVTAYEPIMGRDGQPIGAVYFGIPQQIAKNLRASIMDIRVGRTGYVYVLDSKGRYLVSKNGERDGELIIDARDGAGRPFVREMIDKAHASGPKEIFEVRYPWKNSGEDAQRMKVARLVYFEPWDWIIGAGTYENEIYATCKELESISSNAFILLLVLIGVTLLVAGGAWLGVAHVITRRISKVVEQVQKGSAQIQSASKGVAEAGRSLAAGASDQASSIEETSSSLEEMASMTKQNADHAGQANALMEESKEHVESANTSLTRMVSSMEEISKASDETSKIVKTIEGIAFQTNLLALNAAVEAARAGESGAGFAVVADEVRNLALRAAEAAKNTAGLIEDTTRKVRDGSALVERTSEAFDKVETSALKVAGLVSGIAAASEEQTQGIDRVNAAVADMDQVIQKNAVHAEETAGASEGMSAQAEEMKATVNELVTLVKGTSEHRPTSFDPRSGVFPRPCSDDPAQ